MPAAAEEGAYFIWLHQYQCRRGGTHHPDASKSGGEQPQQGAAASPFPRSGRRCCYVYSAATLCKVFGIVMPRPRSEEEPHGAPGEHQPLTCGLCEQAVDAQVEYIAGGWRLGCKRAPIKPPGDSPVAGPAFSKRAPQSFMPAREPGLARPAGLLPRAAHAPSAPSLPGTCGHCALRSPFHKDCCQDFLLGLAKLESNTGQAKRLRTNAAKRPATGAARGAEAGRRAQPPLAC